MSDIKQEILDGFRKQFCVKDDPTGEELLDKWCADHIEEFISSAIDRVRKVSEAEILTKLEFATKVLNTKRRMKNDTLSPTKVGSV